MSDVSVLYAYCPTALTTSRRPLFARDSRGNNPEDQALGGGESLRVLFLFYSCTLLCVRAFYIIPAARIVYIINTLCNTVQADRATCAVIDAQVAVATEKKKKEANSPFVKFDFSIPFVFS